MPKPKFITDRDELEKLAPMLKAPIKRQVFVCTGKSCSDDNDLQLTFVGRVYKFTMPGTSFLLLSLWHWHAISLEAEARRRRRSE